MRIVQAGFVHRISGEKFRCSTDLPDRVHSFLPALCVAPEHRDLRTRRSEAIRQRSSESSSGTDDDGGFSSEIKKRCAHGGKDNAHTARWQGVRE